MDIVKHLFKTQELLHETVIEFSARTSLCTDIPKEFWTKISVQDTEMILATLLSLDMITPQTDNYCLVESLRTHIGKMAQNYRYEGRWSDIKDYLQNVKPFHFRDGLYFIISKIGTHAFYGNFIKKMVKAIENIKLRKMYQDVVTDRRPVKKSQRKRGYNDKGSRRLPHEFHGSRPLKPEKPESVAILEPRQGKDRYGYLRGSG